MLPTVQGERDYHTIKAIRKLIRANAWSIKTHLGGDAIRHLGIIVSIALYATVSTAHLCVNHIAPGWGGAGIDGGTTAQLAAGLHRWEEAVAIFGTCNNVNRN
jgi:hypothetical protein